jgi:hypothetical protein
MEWTTAAGIALDVVLAVGLVALGYWWGRSIGVTKGRRLQQEAARSIAETARRIQGIATRDEVRRLGARGSAKIHDVDFIDEQRTRGDDEPA